MRTSSRDWELPGEYKRLRREQRHAGWLTDIDEKMIPRCMIYRPAWPTGQGDCRDHSADLRVNEPCGVVLHISHQQVFTKWVKGQTIGPRSYGNSSYHRSAHGVDNQKLAHATRRCKDQCVFLGTEHPAGLRAAGNRREVAQALSIDDLNGASCRIGDEHATTLEVHVPVIEVSLRVEREVNILAQDQCACHRHAPSLRARL